jgi:hypothetical protein
VRRGDFEDLIRRHLDGELVPRGFTLKPQPPANWDDDQPRAVYEANPEDFNRRYPALAVGGDPPCIDLWIQFDPRTGSVIGTLDGPTVEQVSERLGLTRAPTSGPHGTDLGMKLADLAARLGDLLDAAKRHILPERLRAKARSFPEVSMGAQRVALVFASGEVVEDVILAWGEEVVSVAGKEPHALPLFAAIDVVDRSHTGGPSSSAPARSGS